MNKPKINRKNIKAPFKRRKGEEQRLSEAFANVPRITNDTVGAHREEVLKGARKYIYPLQHSKHRVVRISAVLFVAVLLAFFTYVGLSLYKFQATSGFIYDVTRVLPFPVAKAGDAWVSYESYLFELKRNMHYYETQQGTDFDSRDGKTQLSRLKQQAMDSVVRDAYVKQLAAQNNISVSDQEIDQQVQMVRDQNRLGSNDRVFRNVLNEFWGWSVSDFRRELRQQLLQQKVAAHLDTETRVVAQSVLDQLQKGADFVALAAQHSDDQSTKANGGQYPQAITKNNNDIAPQISQALFNLKVGETSDLVSTGYSYEILKVISATEDSVQAAHIQFNIKDISNYVKPVADKEPSERYIKV